MGRLVTAVVLASGLALSGCGGTLDGFSASSSQDVYTPSYYGSPAYPAPGYYAQPGYVSPYAYQPGFVAPYVYEPGWGGGREGWQEHEGRERRERAFDNGGRHQMGQQHQDARPAPQIATQPHSLPPAPMAPTPRPQADQNRRLIDQLGFRPSR